MFVTVLGAVAVIGLVFVLPIACIRDARRYSDAAWASAGMSKNSWIAGMACALVFFIPFVSLIGIAASAIYWTGRRKRLRSASHAAARVPSFGGGFR